MPRFTVIVLDAVESGSPDADRFGDEERARWQIPGKLRGLQIPNLIKLVRQY